MPFFMGFANYIYLVVAALLGLRFIQHAIAVFRDPAEKNAKRMFWFSIKYLFMLFLILVIDHMVFEYVI
jgi:protoheme IX farnesyltransferase